MVSCAALRPSSALLARLRTQSASLARKASRSSRNDGGSSAAVTPPGWGDWDFAKVDSASKTVDTAVGPLPLSPIMDPGYYEATERFKRPKPKPHKPRNSLERQIRSSPYAQALATPVRFCNLTKARLPGYFMQDFDLAAHPETGAPWYIPSMEDATSKLDEDAPTAEPQDNDGGFKTAGPRAKGPTASRLQTHVLANRYLLRSLIEPSSPFRGKQKSLFALTHSVEVKKLGSQAVWREDMETFLLDLIRRRAVHQLLYLARLCEKEDRNYITSFGTWDQVSLEQYRAECILWFGAPSEGRDNAAGSGSAAEPGQFTLLERPDPKQQVPVHNIRKLLGQEYSERLRRDSELFRGSDIFVLSRGRTAKLQLHLWKIQGYMSDRRFSKRNSEDHATKSTRIER